VLARKTGDFLVFDYRLMEKPNATTMVSLNATMHHSISRGRRKDGIDQGGRSRRRSAFERFYPHRKNGGEVVLTDRGKPVGNIAPFFGDRAVDLVMPSFVMHT